MNLVHLIVHLIIGTRSLKPREHPHLIKVHNVAKLDIRNILLDHLGLLSGLTAFMPPKTGIVYVHLNLESQLGLLLQQIKGSYMNLAYIGLYVCAAHL